MFVVLRYFFGLLAVLPAYAAAQDADAGREIARRWCAACHVVERTATEAPANGLPTFPAIAARVDLTNDRLRAAINPQHGRMPDLMLSKRQQDDLIAYIFSLRRR
jgi:mono/diheme cytochrome c family protein